MGLANVVGNDGSIQHQVEELTHAVVCSQFCFIVYCRESAFNVGANIANRCFEYSFLVVNQGCTKHYEQHVLEVGPALDGDFAGLDSFLESAVFLDALQLIYFIHNTKGALSGRFCE